MGGAKPIACWTLTGVHAVFTVESGMKSRECWTLTGVRAVASRYDKTARNYLAMVEIACAWRWLN